MTVDLALGGHCHNVDSIDGPPTPTVESGYRFGGFSRIDLTIDRGAGEVIGSTVAYTKVSYPASSDNPVIPDAAVQAVVDDWQQQADAELGEVVGYTEAGFPAWSWKVANWMMDAWLAEHPEATLALMHFGGMRDPIPIGEFTLSEMVGLLPFNNELYTVDITGAQLQEELLKGITGEVPNSASYPAVGGMTYHHADGNVEITLTGPDTFDPAATYTVIVPDFLHYGGQDYDFEPLDPNPVMLGEVMRDPVIVWTQALGTSASDPVDNDVDSSPRDE